MGQRNSGYERKPNMKVCALCGSDFRRNPKHDRRQWKTARFCSLACANKSRATHGMRRSRLYQIWGGIKQRCLNKNFHVFAHYGARGITVCDEWKNDFAAFATAVGPDPGSGFDLGRIDNDKGYEPGNVRWETNQENANNRRNTVWVEYQGEKMSLKQCCDRASVSYKRTHQRLKKGWSWPEALGDVNS